jgi:hypothetical protein
MSPEILNGAILARIFPALKHSSILSIGQLCDHVREAHFDAHKVTIHHYSTQKVDDSESSSNYGSNYEDTVEATPKDMQTTEDTISSFAKHFLAREEHGT